MDGEAWAELSAALMVRLHWSWPDLAATPLSVVEATLDRLRGPQQSGGE